MKTPKIKMSEAELCAGFIQAIDEPKRKTGHAVWTAYPETAGFDILLVRNADGMQIGVEAKLSLNTKVVCQALPYRSTRFYAHTGPDYRAVLIPPYSTSGEIERICEALGITVITYRGSKGGPYYGAYSYGPAFTPSLPQEGAPDHYMEPWHEWCPIKRCDVPDYIPDVKAGVSSPVSLSDWKVRAIKLLVIAHSRPVKAADFKTLNLSRTLWTGPRGWLEKTPEGWVPGRRTPDLRKQHPRNFAEIEADREKWDKPVETGLKL